MATYGGLFGRNPFDPVHEHALKVQDCLGPLVRVINAFIDGERDRLLQECERIRRLEGEADYIKNELRRQLTRSMFSRLERSDILALVNVQDDVSDGCEAAAILMEARRTASVPSLATPLSKLAEQVAVVGRMLPEITQLLREHPRPGTFSEKLSNHAIDVHQASFEAASLVRDFLKRLFAVESELDPVSVVLLMRLAETLGAIAGSAENVADCAVRIASGA